MLTFEEIQRYSNFNKQGIAEYYINQTCGDCHTRKSYLVFSRRDERFYNICDVCAENHVESYIKAKKLDAQEIFILKMMLN